MGYKNLIFLNFCSFRKPKKQTSINKQQEKLDFLKNLEKKKPEKKNNLQL